LLPGAGFKTVLALTESFSSEIQGKFYPTALYVSWIRPQKCLSALPFHLSRHGSFLVQKDQRVDGQILSLKLQDDRSQTNGISEQIHFKRAAWW